MWIPSNKNKRFTLYHLEENEIYIRDFSGLCTYIDPISGDEKPREKGKFFICSKTIVFEAEQSSIPLLKFKFEAMRIEPRLWTDESNKSKKEEAIIFNVNKVTTIRVSSSIPPEPFKHYEDINHRVLIYPSFESADKLMEWIGWLHTQAKKKNVYDLEERIYQLIIEKENKKGFNMSLIDSVSEKPIQEETNIFVRRILPLNHLYGYMFMTDVKVYFQPFHSISGKSVHKIEIRDIAKLFKRRFELREIGLQIITETGKSYYFTFDSINHRNRMYTALSKRVSEKCVKEETLQKITYMWQTKQITNYEYLVHLNQNGNRSFSDLSQYPVFPWVLKDYQSETINLNDNSVYRDLSKPIGALNEDRLRAFLERYEDMPAPKFMYGSHYSAPGYVIGYLVRKKPEYMLKLQSGKFDKPDRLFKSIKGDWKNVMENPTSLKQLIPEFYQNDPSFLLNELNLDLGVRQNKKRVGDVKIPKWANGDPRIFLQTMKKALESDYVSENLHCWIDLIFGSKQRGQEAIKAHNLFNYMTYEGMIDVEAIKDPIEKMGVKCQINEFGQCPKQIFKIPHPPRNALIVLGSIPSMPSASQAQDSDSEEQAKPELLVKQNPIKNLEPSSMFSSAGRPKIKTILSMGKPSDIKVSQIPKAHKLAITEIAVLNSKPNTVVTIGQDGFLKVFDTYEKTCLKSFKICQFCLSAIVPIKGDQLFAIGSWDNNIYIFNIVYGSKSKPVNAHDNSVSDLLYLPKHKKLVSSSWDCSIKFWRVVGSNLDNQEVFQDHDNQITSLAANEEETMLAFGDIQGNVIAVNIEQREKLFQININSQKISRLIYLKNNLVASGQIDIRLLDSNVEKSNGQLTDLKLDGEHLFSLTSRKHLGVYDILQEKKLGSYFNDYRNVDSDKMPNQKELTCLASSNDSTVVIVGSSTGNLYILRS